MVWCLLGLWCANVIGFGAQFKVDMWKNLSELMTKLEIDNLAIGEVYHLRDKQLCIADNLKISIDANSNEKIIRLVDDDLNIDILSVHWIEVENCLSKILLMYFYESYARIKEHLLFQKVYGYAERNILFMRGSAVLPVLEKTFACMQCGLVLPEKNITIDHIYPQAGGELEAVLRCFAAAGLTTQRLLDDFGAAFFKNSQGSHIELAANIMDASKWPTIAPCEQIFSRATVFGSTPLNEFGILVLSLLIWAEDFEQTKFNCMNSLLNLRPVCLGCNAAKGNKI